MTSAFKPSHLQAVVALAGFYVGETYHVPWAGVPVPGKLQTKLFPFVENALANLKAASRVNQGVINFLELLQQLRPFFWRVGAHCFSLPYAANIPYLSLQASAAIYEHFPGCSLFHRMKVFAFPDAKNFLDAWPGLVLGTVHELEAEAAIAATFSEASTQTAFMSLATRQKELESSLRVQTAQLNILTNRTEPLSPSYRRSDVRDALVSATIGLTPERRDGPSQVAYRSDPPSLPPSLCAHCGHHGTPDRDSSHLHEQPLTAPVGPSPMLPSADPVGAGSELQHSHFNLNVSVMPPRNDLCVVLVKAHSRLFHVLRLCPGPMAPPTPFDIILPAAAAFCNSVEKVQASQSQYPTFTPSTCGWHAIFEQIIHPALLWDCWGPGSLGEYPDVLTLWKSWDEGMAIEGVGQRPPLRLVDARWGCHRDVRSKKGHLPAWRPRNDDNVCRFYKCPEKNSSSFSLGTTKMVPVPVLHPAHRGERSEWQDSTSDHS